MRSIILCFAAVAAVCSAAERPNILWLTCEDISPYLGCYGCREAQTPNLDRLADEGVRFTRAYANAPVCAVARSTLLTGMHAVTLGTHGMRARTQLPTAIPAYPKLFREAGYYCTNNSKTDYNSSFEADKSLWDESSGKATWKNRPEGRPFFAVFNTTVTHESQLAAKRIAEYVAKGQIPEKPRIDPAAVPLPPYHPDLPEIRTDWARLHDLITLMDTIVGRHLKDLEDAGVADDTIVFFYADHGGQLSRSKRYIYNVGTQVPLIVRVPGKWRHLAPGAPGSVNEMIAQFVDFPKTVLALAGIRVPELMQGRILFGDRKESPARYAHLYRDRMAERHDCSRAVTDGRYYLIRNFVPHRPRGRDSRYGHTVQANWGAWERWYDGNPEAAGAIRSQFFKPKPPLELFDTQADPWHVRNLADDPACRAVREQLERELDAFQIRVRDVGLVPEALLYDFAGPGKKHATLYEFGQSGDYDTAAVIRAAQSASLGDSVRRDDYLKMTADADAVVRYYGAYALFLLRDANSEVQEALRKMARSDSSAGNRIMAAQALGVCGDADLAFAVITREAESAGGRGYVFHAAINALQYAHVDNRLSRAEWQRFKELSGAKSITGDQFGFDYARRIIDDALALWPQRRRVD